MTDAELPRDRLLNYLSKLPNGPLPPEAWKEAGDLLALIWPDISGSDDTSMAPWKLERAEDPTWTRPTLTFVIERHGAVVVGGSTRAELQTWTVDIERMEAFVGGVGVRQKTPPAPRLDVLPLADEIAHSVLAGTDHKAIKWKEPGRAFRLLINSAIPNDGFKQTIADRRKRFRKALRQRLPGWVEGRAGNWTYS